MLSVIIYTSFVYLIYLDLNIEIQTAFRERSSQAIVWDVQIVYDTFFNMIHL